MKNFVLIGAGGYIAPRHMKAIKETGNNLLAAVDKHDSVGILDSYFPDTEFFTEFERFDRHVEKLRRQGTKIDYVSVCSPNYLHDAHIRFGFRTGADVICEKPLVLNPWNIEALHEIEKETGRKVFNILQLRLHPKIIELRQKVQSQSNRIYNIDLTYITSRGHWYFTSWKGDVSKSGGIATNIGVHFFDMLIWIFGGVKRNIVHLLEPDKASGYIDLEKARVRWFLSIDVNSIPAPIREAGKKTYRSLQIEGDEFEFSEGFTDLHTRSYEEILNNNGFPIKEVVPCIEVVHEIRNAKPIGKMGDFHPLAFK
ncbi:MAG: Gfo/Idh/MocA family oxidoreductase [Bacteroidetes bacterium]|nr:Gfo/Idh/MocA family oxidoreductase [Bacteroidota bacterium]MBS1609330.1 Gfo/Idh/MocA family oxidoreductase [Bacteroidota bacterium]